MKNIKYIIIILLLFVCFDVNAICDSNKLKELKDIADKIEFTYEYKIINLKNSKDGRINDIEFTIKAYNLNQNIKPLIIKDYYTDDFKEFKYDSTKSASLSGFKEGERVSITFKAYTKDECSGLTVGTKVISLPYYNWFYNLADCKNNRDFKYCKTQLVNTKIDSELFGEELKKYEDSKKVIHDDENNKKSEINIKEIIGLIVIITIILTLIGIIIVRIKQIIKKRSL